MGWIGRAGHDVHLTSERFRDDPDAGDKVDDPSGLLALGELAFLPRQFDQETLEEGDQETLEAAEAVVVSTYRLNEEPSPGESGE